MPDLPRSPSPPSKHSRIASSDDEQSPPSSKRQHNITDIPSTHSAVDLSTLPTLPTFPTLPTIDIDDDGSNNSAAQQDLQPQESPVGPGAETRERPSAGCLSSCLRQSRMLRAVGSRTHTDGNFLALLSFKDDAELVVACGLISDGLTCDPPQWHMCVRTTHSLG